MCDDARWSGRRTAHDRRRTWPGGGEERSESGRRGFTLIELLVAVVLLAVGLLGLTGVMLGTSQRQDLVGSQLDFAAAASSKVEDLHAAAYAVGAKKQQLALGGSLTADEAQHADVYTTPDGRQFSRRWRVEAGPQDTRRVTVRITAAGGGRTVARRDYVTLIYVR